MENRVAWTPATEWAVFADNETAANSLPIPSFLQLCRADSLPKGIPQQCHDTDFLLLPSSYLGAFTKFWLILLICLPQQEQSTYLQHFTRLQGLYTRLSVVC